MISAIRSGLTCSNWCSLPKKGEGRCISPNWRMIPGLVALVATVTAIFFAFVWNCPSLCIAFAPGAAASVYLIYQGRNSQNLKTFEENNTQLEDSLNTLKIESEGLHTKLEVFQKENDQLQLSTKKLEEQTIKLESENHNYAEENKNFAETNKNFAETNKNFVEANKNFVEANKILAEENKNFAETNKTFAEANKTFAEANKTLVEENKTFAEANKNYAEENKNFAEENKIYAEANKKLNDTILELQEIQKTHVEQLDMHEKQLEMHVKQLGMHVMQQANLFTSLIDLQQCTEKDHTTFASKSEIFAQQVELMRTTFSGIQEKESAMQQKVKETVDVSLKTAMKLEKIFAIISDWKNEQLIAIRLNDQKALEENLQKSYMHLAELERQSGRQEGQLEEQHKQIEELRKQIYDLNELKIGYTTALQTLSQDIFRLQGIMSEFSTIQGGWQKESANWAKAAKLIDELIAVKESFDKYALKNIRPN
jgi:hypothetical protein